MIHLLDANFLMALGDTNHPHRAAAIRFFQKSATVDGWASCALTENAFLRILGGPGYPNGAGSPTEARLLLHRILSAPGHQFWSEDLSFADTRRFPVLPESKHLTDLYLLALALKHGGRLATFDRRIPAHLMPGGAEAMLIIPPA